MSAPPSSAQKRPAADAGLDPPPSAARARPARASAASFMGLNEETLAGQRDPALVADLQEEIASREWWDQWSTDFLFAWLWDFGEKRPAAFKITDAGNRGLILASLVSGRFARPLEDDEETQFRMAWCKATGVKTKKQLKEAVYPSPRHAPASSADAAAAIRASSGGLLPPPPREEQEEKKQGGGPRQLAVVAVSSAVAASASASPLSPKPARVPSPDPFAQQGGEPDEEDEEIGDWEMEEVPEKEFAQFQSYHRPALLPVAAAAASGGPLKGAPRPETSRVAIPAKARACKTCLKAPTDPSATMWICVCGLRGDQPADSATNVALREINARNAAGPEAPGGAASSTAGQSTAQGSEAKGFERDLNAILRGGTKHPLFVGPEAAAALSHGEAIAIVRKALGASATQIPCKPLIAVVRAGMLVDLSLALPRPLANLKDKKGAVLTLDGVDVPLQASHQTVKTVRSLHAFMTAMFGVVLPCCIDLPMALAQWCSLCVTVLELTEKNGWERANQYVEQLLQERVAEGAEFATPSASCLQTLQHATPAAAGTGGFRAGPRAPSRFCDAYNWSQAGCPFGRDCEAEHTCQFVGRPLCVNPSGHRSFDCPGRRSQSQGGAPRHNGGSQRGGRGGGGGGGGYRGGGGGGSVAGSSVASSAKQNQA